MQDLPRQRLAPAAGRCAGLQGGCRRIVTERAGSGPQPGTRPAGGPAVVTGVDETWLSIGGASRPVAVVL